MKEWENSMHSRPLKTLWESMKQPNRLCTGPLQLSQPAFCASANRPRALRSEPPQPATLALWAQATPDTPHCAAVPGPDRCTLRTSLSGFPWPPPQAGLSKKAWWGPTPWRWEGIKAHILGHLVGHFLGGKTSQSPPPTAGRPLWNLRGN